MSKKKKKKSGSKKIIIFIIELLVLVLLLLGLFVYSKLGKVEKGEDITEEDAEINELTSETQEILSGYKCIALFGLDNRDVGSYDGGNSDSIMILVIDNDTKEIKILSVYRDTFLNVYDTSYQKVNAAYSKSGVKSAIAALNKNLDLAITDYVCVDFNAVVEAIDLLGGIELTLTDEEIEYMNTIYIPEIEQVTGKSSSLLTSGGTYTVDGTQALAYCRVRYTSGDDFKRTERQRTVLSKMLDKVKSSDLVTLNNLINAMLEYISTDISSTELISLATSAISYDLAGTQGWPFELTTGSFGSKGDLVVPCDLVTNVTELHEYLFGETNYSPSSTVQSISDEIKNYTGCTTESATRVDNPLTVEDDSETTE
ncbi:MAG: LCP family protein [Lachnospiraceae bacterium]|nr:LCP family protein [Lachnospiraceae bacterium]